MVISEQKKPVDFFYSVFSSFCDFFIGFKQIVRTKPFICVFVIHVVFIVLPCLSYSFSESPGQNWHKSRNCAFLIAEMQNESFSNVGFFVKPSGAEVKDVSTFNKWLPEFSSTLEEFFLGFGRAIEQICSVGSQQNSEDSDKYWGHCFLLGVFFVFDCSFHF